MSNTYTQLYIQIVFAVKRRENLISKNNREELHKYITGIIQSRDHKLLAIFCMPNHAHILVGLNPNMSISYLVRDIKAHSTNFINRSGWIKGKFSWQEGYGAFSYSKKDLDRVAKYILNQKEHHITESFKKEYIDLLNEFKIEYQEKYLFDWV